MKYLSKRIVIIILGLFVIMAAGNVIAADVDASQVKGKLELADYLPQTNRQTAADSLLLAKLQSSTQPLRSSALISTREAISDKPACNGNEDYCPLNNSCIPKNSLCT